MIAWNEADVIGRAIESCSSFLDYAVVIVDSRTIDETKAVVIDVCDKYNIPCSVIVKDWVDFATNRNIAMDYSRKTGCDYSLILDADEVVKLNNFDKDSLTHDGYNLEVEYGGQKFASTRLIKLEKPWIWNGVIHNYLSCEGLTETPNIPSFGVHHIHDGYRSKDPNKVKNDVKILKKAVKDFPDNSRYWFYYAQTLRENGNYKESIKAYMKRIEFGEWSEEVWYSMYMVATQYEILDDFTKGMEWYLKAYQYRPTRMEPLYHLAVWCRRRSYRHLGYMFLRQCLEIKIPNDMLFIEPDMYEYQALFEYGIATYWVGKFQESFDVNMWLINNTDMPDEYLTQTKENLGFSARKLKIEVPWDNYQESDKMIYYNDGMSTFGENYIKNYGYTRVHLGDHEGILWFGVYSEEELNTLIASEKNFAMHWCGSDVLYVINDPRASELAKKTNIRFTCETEDARQELASVGIMAEFAPMFSERFEDYPFTDNEKVFDVCVYCHPNKFLYNRQLMIDVAEAMPELKFCFFGDRFEAPDNVLCDGWVEQDTVKDILSSSRVYLRVTEHDGYPDLVIKSCLLGTQVVSNWDFMGCMVTNKNNIIDTIKSALKCRNGKEISDFYRNSNLINNWEKIYGHEQFLQLQDLGKTGDCNPDGCFGTVMED